MNGKISHINEKMYQMSMFGVFYSNILYVMTQVGWLDVLATHIHAHIVCNLSGFLLSICLDNKISPQYILSVR